MRVIRSRYENHIDFLAVLFEDLPPVRIPRGLLPAFLAVDATPPRLVDFGEGDTLKALAVTYTCMGPGPAACSVARPATRLAPSPENVRSSRSASSPSEYIGNDYSVAAWLSLSVTLAVTL